MLQSYHASLYVALCLQDWRLGYYLFFILSLFIVVVKYIEKMEPEVLTEVPASLKRLIRLVVRGFYSIEHAIVIDLLVRNPCMKEDDIIELLKFDRKQLRAYVNTLKNEKFLKVRMRVETDSEGKMTRHNYYFINYLMFVNVVKYKLDHVRRKIEMEERDNTSRASFKCPSCEKTFTDLEADQLFDMSLQKFICTMCQEEVVEDESAVMKKDARTLLAKFNEQIEPLYVLLRECDGISLSQDLLEPEPTDLKHAARYIQRNVNFIYSQTCPCGHLFLVLS
jgi:transcription initiation factor TFIIE subunit alpha